MKAYLDSLLKSDNKTFSLVESNIYHALNDFHYHPELELVYITEGEGVLLIGDKFEQLSGGMMLVIGCNVPHMFKFDTYTYQNALMQQGKIPLPLKLLTLHFDPAVFGDSFMQLPENALINVLLKEALKGLNLHKDSQGPILELMTRLTIAPNYEHIWLLIQLLNTIAISAGKSFITKPPDENAYNKTDEMRLTKIYLYTLNNFSRAIKLREIAEIVHMVPNAFCRYFKQRTGKSYFDFLLGVRIKHACKLLKEKDYTIVVVCYESGFSNLSNFNRYFKLITGKTPLGYRKNFQE